MAGNGQHLATDGYRLGYRLGIGAGGIDLQSQVTDDFQQRPVPVAVCHFLADLFLPEADGYHPYPVCHAVFLLFLLQEQWRVCDAAVCGFAV